MVFKLHRIFFCLIFLFLLIKPSAGALDKKVSSALSHYIMAVMYDKLGDSNSAIKEYKSALKNDYENILIHLNLAMAYIKINQLKDAVDTLNDAVKISPDAVEPHAILTLLYFLQNKPGELDIEYEKALKNASKHDPKNISVYKNLGLLYMQQKKFQTAENMFKLMLQFSPDNPEAHYYLGMLYEQTADKQKSEAELKRAIELKPDYDEALNYLGFMYVQENRNLDKAELMIKKALEIEPDNGAYVDSLGWLYFMKGKINEAITQLMQASRLIEDPVVYDHLGDAYYKAGDIENARINWQKSLKLDPKQEKVKEKIKGPDKH